MEVPIELIHPSPYQPRLTFNIDDLKEEIERDGLLSALVVRRRDDHYELLDGERRLRTLKELGWKMVPVDVREVDDRTARRSVFKLNMVRENYTTEEKARYFKKLADEGMKPYQIGQELNVDDSWVRAHLNVFLLPEDIQEAIWADQLSISTIREMESVIGANIDEGIAIAREAFARKLTSKQTRDLLKPRIEEIERGRIEAARQALEAKNQTIGAAAPIALETPEDYERAAVALRREAQKQREAAIPPEERAKIEAEKQERREQTRKRSEEARKQEIEEEARKRAQEIIKDTNFVREFVAREYVLTTDDVRTEDLQEALMQKLMANIPEEKRQRAKGIFNEEFNSLQKRLEIFPEKSRRFEPKLNRFRELVARGVIPYTVWDFTDRDDYAGDKDFHGNCSPQIVEQCIWRLTEEGDLVVDPMAGSGTALDVCRRFNRKCIGYDIKPPVDRSDIIQNDSRHIPLESDTVDMIFIHPPYWNMVYFTKADERLSDLSRAASVGEFSEMLKQVFQECYRVLKHGKFMCVLLGDLIRDGSFIPLCRKTTDMAEEIGFVDYGYAVKLAHGEVSRKKSGVISIEPIITDNMKISHDLVLFLKKGG